MGLRICRPSTFPRIAGITFLMRHLSSADVKFVLRNSILPKASKPSGHSRNHSMPHNHMACPLSIFCIRKIHRLKATVERAILGIEGQQQTNYFIQPAQSNHDWECLGSVLGSVHNCTEGNRSALQRSFELSSRAEDVELFFMNSVASTLNRVTGMEFNNKISVLTPNNWNTWKHDIQVLLMHYGCWQFIIQTKTEQPDEEATYQEKLNLQLRKDRCYTLIYTNISSDLKNLITETTDGVAAWKILKDHFEPVTRARSTVQQIYRWKEEDFRVVKFEAELILEANRLQLMKQDLEKAENAYMSSFKEVEDVTWCYGCRSKWQE
ncbi:retrovirus-related Pol polyprotein from transposon TNT 1-94 [Trichonephila clavipes]|nr:retrovirus-related Pol polyprotein from transposon TNT 1-94 [Trichonephila clavipes]